MPMTLKPIKMLTPEQAAELKARIKAHNILLVVNFAVFLAPMVWMFLWGWMRVTSENKLAYLIIFVIVSQAAAKLNEYCGDWITHITLGFKENTGGHK